MSMAGPDADGVIMYLIRWSAKQSSANVAKSAPGRQQPTTIPTVTSICKWHSKLSKRKCSVIDYHAKQLIMSNIRGSNSYRNESIILLWKQRAISTNILLKPMNWFTSLKRHNSVKSQLHNKAKEHAYAQLKLWNHWHHWQWHLLN